MFLYLPNSANMTEHHIALDMKFMSSVNDDKNFNNFIFFNHLILQYFMLQLLYFRIHTVFQNIPVA